MVTIYADPIKETGFPAKAEVLKVLKVLKDYGTMKYCKVKMSTGEICNVFIKK